ncbi:DUF4430 domain-containing protein [Alkalibacterium kapii]|uniref:Transcobalamin-like C-terminal domain-containing protein n=1 Tax=Alkalibacterium kapii TaxID=426704 RepID=A0A511AUN6_9LACT|nr:DUF4430 domain-containing protein [Alkalibacterium kapii]GEK91918.1 hypothetical protein AKA01nite_15400 [Alkalibacterium kapii]
MKKKQKLLIAVAGSIILIVLALLLNGMFSNDTTDQASSPDMKEISITLQVQEDEVSSDSFEVMNDTTLMELMEDNFDVATSDEGFVQAIDGYEQDKDKGLYWIFEANEEMVEVSAEEFVPEDGDEIMWMLTSF